MTTPIRTPRRLIPLPVTTDFSGMRPTALYAQVKAGLFPPPIKLGRSSRWIEDEVARAIEARIRGLSDDHLRALVKELVAARSQPAAS